MLASSCRSTAEESLVTNAAPTLTAPANRLLSQLPVHQRNAIHRGSELSFHSVGDVLLHSNTHSNYVFFPIEAVVSIVRPLRGDLFVELGLIGNEGMIGLDVIMDAKTQPDDTIVQSAGSALRMPADDLLKLFYGGGPLQKQLLRFTHAFLGQVAQNAACNRFHALAARMAKWLLMIHDRSASPEVRSTPRLMALALGASEKEIDETLQRLAATGGIRQKRDAVFIEREILELNACDCYEALREAYGRTLTS
jgi:CRP-like cAMP-binding protein